MFLQSTVRKFERERLHMENRRMSIVDKWNGYDTRRKE